MVVCREIGQVIGTEIGAHLLPLGQGIPNLEMIGQDRELEQEVEVEVELVIEISFLDLVSALNFVKNIVRNYYVVILFIGLMTFTLDLTTTFLLTR